MPHKTTKKPDAKRASLRTKANGRGVRPGLTVLNEMNLARELGVAARTIKLWKTIEGNPGSDSGGRYKVDDWRRWAAENGKKVPAGATTKSEWEVERIKRQVERLDLELKQRRGDLVPVEDVKRWAAEMVYAFRTEILGIPGKLAPQVVGLTIAEAEIRLRQAVHDSLTKLSREPWAKE